MSVDSRRSTTASEPDIPGAFPDPADAALSSQQTLSQAVYARRAEYTNPRTIKVKIGTWNVGGSSAARDIGSWFCEGKGVDQHFSRLSLNIKQDLEDAKKHSQTDPDLESVKAQEARQSRMSKHDPTVPTGDRGLVPGGDQIGLYVLGLQEIVDVTSPAEALRPYTDPAPANKFKDELNDVLPAGYELVAEQQLIGLLLLIFASPEVVPDVRSVSTTSVGTGLMGYMGNKGAVTAHIILGESTRVVFINSHLAAGADKASLERRNWDANQVLTRTRFSKIDDPSGIPNSGESIGDEDFAFWFGDLNYRLESIPGDDVRRLLTLHTRNEYDLEMIKKQLEEKQAKDHEDPGQSVPKSDGASTKSNVSGKSAGSSQGNNHAEIPDDLDPASLQTTLASLLPHDELAQQIRTRKAFYEGWREGPIRFLPTYKYDVGSVAVFDSSEKKRSPSWCDRILYRTRNDYMAYKQRLQDQEAARKKDEEMKARGLDEDENVIFDYNPEDDGDDLFEQTGPENEEVTTKDGVEAEILLEHYTAHQRVLSSDHKPLDAVFSLTYQAVDADLKTKMHAEVTRMLDRNENEGRPTVTVVIDHNHIKDDLHSPGSQSSLQDVEGVIHFGGIRFKKVKHRHVTIANTGQVPATVSFIDRPVSGLGEEGPFPPWLLANWDREADAKDKKSKNKGDPPAYSLEPGDVCNIEFIAHVESMDTARDLNDAIFKLEDVLILRVQNGRDHFLPVQGHWVRSSLDRSIDKLKKLPEDGIRKLQGQKLGGASGLFSLRKSDG